MRFNNKNYELPIVTIPMPVLGPASDEIWYTTTSGNALNTSLPNQISNTYTDGKGVIKFSAPLTSTDWSFGLGNKLWDLETIWFPKGLTTMGSASTNNFLLYYNDNLTSVIVPNTVTEIPGLMCNSCSHLTSESLNSTILHSNITAIGWGAFANCMSLTSVIIPDSVTTIYGATFVNITNLTTATLGSGLQTIGDGMFENCTGLTTVNYNGTMSQWGQITFGSNVFANTQVSVIHCTDGDVTL